MTAASLFEKLRATLEGSGIPYFVTGSFVSSAHGVPRSTNDIDVMIAPTPEQLEGLLREFSFPAFYSDRADALDALERRSQFNVIDNQTLWKIDFIVSKDTPFDRSRFERRRVTEISGVDVFAATAEDIVIAKLIWSKLGESQRQIEDAAGVIRVQTGKLDLSYIQSWVDALDLGEQWQAARDRA